MPATPTPEEFFAYISPNYEPAPAQMLALLPEPPEGHVAWLHLGLGAPGRALSMVCGRPTLLVEHTSHEKVHVHSAFDGYSGTDGDCHYFLAVPAELAANDPTPPGTPTQLPALPPGFLLWKYLGIGASLAHLTQEERRIRICGWTPELDSLCWDLCTSPRGSWRGGVAGHHYFEAVNYPRVFFKGGISATWAGATAGPAHRAHVSRRPPAGVRRAVITKLNLP